MKNLLKNICAIFGYILSVFSPFIKFNSRIWANTYSGYKRLCFNSIQGGVSISPYTKKIEGGDIGKNCSFGKGLWLEAIKKYGELTFKPSITIGNNCHFGDFNHIAAINEIKIGNGVLTGQFVLIEDHSHGFTGKEDGIDSTISVPPSVRPLVCKGKIIIEDNVWLGDKVAVLSGVTIGQGAVIGANSVVTHDIPAGAIAAGVPAKIIRLRSVL